MPQEHGSLAFTHSATPSARQLQLAERGPFPEKYSLLANCQRHLAGRGLRRRADELDCPGELCTRPHEDRRTQRTKGPYFPILPDKAARCRSFPGFAGVPLHRCTFHTEPLCNHCRSLHVVAFHCISFHFIASLHATIATMQRKALCAGFHDPAPSPTAGRASAMGDLRSGEAAWCGWQSSPGT